MKTVYTAIFGKYDELKEPAILTNGWKHICFTDQDFKSDVWEIRKVPVMDLGPEKTARYYKIMFHRHIETEFSLWIDGTFIINTNLDHWWERFRPEFTAIKHHFDDCIYKDAQSCLESGRGKPYLINRQIAFYKAVGIQKNEGLIASGILMRQKSEAVKKFCTDWWEQVRRFSRRDQIAWGYANHIHPGVVNMTEWNYQQQREFWHVPHIHKKHRMIPTQGQLRRYASNQG